MPVQIQYIPETDGMLAGVEATQTTLDLQKPFCSLDGVWTGATGEVNYINSADWSKNLVKSYISYLVYGTLLYFIVMPLVKLILILIKQKIKKLFKKLKVKCKICLLPNKRLGRILCPGMFRKRRSDLLNAMMCKETLKNTALNEG